MKKLILYLFMLASFSIDTNEIFNFFIYNRALAPALMVAGIRTIDDLKRKHPTSIRVVDISDKEIWLDAQWFVDN